jgi:hypothetical protein
VLDEVNIHLYAASGLIFREIIRGAHWIGRWVGLRGSVGFILTKKAPAENHTTIVKSIVSDFNELAHIKAKHLEAN